MRKAETEVSFSLKMIKKKKQNRSVSVRARVPRATASTRHEEGEELRTKPRDSGAATPFGMKLAGKLHSRLSKENGSFLIRFGKVRGFLKTPASCSC